MSSVSSSVSSDRSPDEPARPAARRHVERACANLPDSRQRRTKEDPLKFATGLAVGIACTVAVAAVCSTGVGCLILAGAVAGAAAAGAEYGVDVAQGEREFSGWDLGKEMAIGGAVGAVGAGAGIVGGKVLAGAPRSARPWREGRQGSR
jgi:hypothetical protein